MRTDDDHGFFHVCTNGTVLPWMFKDNEDFIYGMNRIGICHLLTGITVLVFTLMDNHVHFILYGARERCRMFIDKYKLLTGKWIFHKYGLPKYLKHLPISIIPLKTEEDILETAAYIDRNAIMGGFPGMPYEYPWSSCRFMFRTDEDKKVRWNLKKDFTDNELRGILKSRISLPEDWTFDDNRMLNPMHFTDIRKMESLFKSPARYLYFLVKKLEGKINQTLEQDDRPFVSDKDLREITAGIALRRFGSKDIRTLNVNSRLLIARQLKHDYASSTKQLSRMLHLDAATLKDFI